MKLVNEVIFWLFILIILILGFGYRISDYSGAFLFTSFFFPVLIAISYTFSEFLIPNYLLKKRYFQFILYSIYSIIIGLNLTILVMVLSFSVLANYRYEAMLPASRDVFGLALIILFIALLKSSWKLVRKLLSQEGKIQDLETKERLKLEGHIRVKADRKEYRLAHENIIFIESMADYIKIHQLIGDIIISREKISSIQTRLPSQFIRIHRSYLINIEHASTFTAESININGHSLTIGRKYKPEVQKVLKNQDSQTN